VYEKIVEGLEETKHDLLQDIRELKNQRDDQAYLIQEQAVMLVTSRITSYYDAKNKSNHGEQTISRHTSVLQKLILKEGESATTARSLVILIRRRTLAETDDLAYLIQEQTVMITSRITSHDDAKNKSGHGEQQSRDIHLFSRNLSQRR
jgi:hypothetical protein